MSISFVGVHISHLIDKASRQPFTEAFSIRVGDEEKG
ncbi:unnamed protein product [Ectocarpus sp. 12 AP-2014]